MLMKYGNDEYIYMGLFLITIIRMVHSQIDDIEWLSPLNNRNKVAALCTQDNRQLVMDRPGAFLVSIFFPKGRQYQ